MIFELFFFSYWDSTLAVWMCYWLTLRVELGGIDPSSLYCMKWNKDSLQSPRTILSVCVLRACLVCCLTVIASLLKNAVYVTPLSAVLLPAGLTIAHWFPSWLFYLFILFNGCGRAPTQAHIWVVMTSNVPRISTKWSTANRFFFIMILIIIIIWYLLEHSELFLV